MADDDGKSTGDGVDDPERSVQDARSEKADLEASPADLESHPGAPRSRDEIDPELISLRKKIITAGPLLSIAVIIFSVYIMLRLLPDLRFSRQAEAPRAVDDVSKVANRQGFGAEDFVLMRATPDRSFAVLVAPSGTTEGHRVAPVQGTHGKLWLMMTSEPWAEKPAYDDIYRGRLRELDDMPFAEPLRNYVRDAGALPQSVTASAVRVALESKASSVLRPSGDAIELTDSMPVVISETVAGQAIVRAFLRPDRLPDHAAWGAALVKAGIMSAETQPFHADDQEIRYQVSAPGGPAAVKAKIAAAQLFAARVEPRMRDHTATWGQLSASPAGLSLPGSTVPWTSISATVVQAPRTVPADAMVLITDDVPGTYWYLLALYIVLGLFVILFSWALVRALRPQKPTIGASKVAQSAA